MKGYTPTMPEEEVWKRREWKRRVREDLLRSTREKEVCLPHPCVHLMIPWGVHPPLWEDSRLLASVVNKEIKPGTSVLDLGTGSGIQGIVAALRGAFVLSTDIHARALQAAKWNAERHNVSDYLDVRESDLFTNVPEKFDSIVFNPPHLWFPAEDMLDRAITDENYEMFDAFLDTARTHLESNGKIILVCSTIGDVEHMLNCIRTYGYTMRVLDSHISDSHWHYAVYELR